MIRLCIIAGMMWAIPFTVVAQDIDVNLSVLDQPSADVAVDDVQVPLSPTPQSVEDFRKKYSVYPFSNDTILAPKKSKAPIKAERLSGDIPPPPVKDVAAPVVSQAVNEVVSAPQVPAVVEDVIESVTDEAAEIAADVEDVADDLIEEAVEVVDESVDISALPDEAATDISDVVVDKVIPSSAPDLAAAMQPEVIDVTATPGPFAAQNTDAMDEDSGAPQQVPQGTLISGVGYNGDDIRLDEIVMEALRSVYIPQINAKPNARLGLYAYASAEQRGERKARRLSLSRALELRSFLVAEGVDPARIDIFPLGHLSKDGFADRVDLILSP